MSLVDDLESIQAPMSAWLSRLDPATTITVCVLVVVVILGRRPLANFLTGLVARLLSHMSLEMSDEVLTEARALMRVVIVAGSLLFALDILDPPTFAGGLLERCLISVLVLATFVAWYRLVEPMISIIGPEKFSDITVEANWVVRLGQFVVVLLAITALLSVWNIDISSALTGVGVLGAGLAIAGQDFVRNLFAGMNNMSERRFESGDWIAVDGVVEGTVKRVDVRSTTIMGFDRVPHYVPNSELSNAIVLNKSRMDHRRVYWTIPLVLTATDAQVEQMCNEVLEHMRGSEDFVTDGSCVLIAQPVGLSDCAIEVLVYGFTQTDAYQPYLGVCGRLVVAVRRAITSAGTELAYPTRKLILSGDESGVSADTAPVPKDL